MLPVTEQFSILYLMTWGLAMLFQACLLFTLFARGLLRRFPALCVYLLLNLFNQLMLVLFFYPHFGFHSLLAWRVAWVSQGTIVAARAIAVGELCHHVMARFRGVWALGWRLLGIIVAAVLAVAISLGRHDFVVLVLTLDLSVELAIAVTVVGLFVFAKHYDLEIGEPLRSLGLGFCLYSCVYVANDVFAQHFMRSYSGIWNFVGTVTFMTCVALWLRAFLGPVPAPATQPVMLDANVYSKLIPEVNRRLVLLNEQLSRIWKAETHHT
jgi:hypothetical protein